MSLFWSFKMLKITRQQLELTSLTSNNIKWKKLLVLLKRNGLKIHYFFWSLIYVSSQNDGQTERLYGQMVKILTGRYFKPLFFL